jgi:hypothetical protein
MNLIPFNKSVLTAMVSLCLIATLARDAIAAQVLAADPTCYDAYLAGGVSRYIVVSMAAPVRWLLRVGGIPGDKEGGISELQPTVAHGQLLAPFTRILLAIAYVRENWRDSTNGESLSACKVKPVHQKFTAL